MIARGDALRMLALSALPLVWPVGSRDGPPTVAADIDGYGIGMPGMVGGATRSGSGGGLLLGSVYIRRAGDCEAGVLRPSEGEGAAVKTQCVVSETSSHRIATEMTGPRTQCSNSPD